MDCLFCAIVSGDIPATIVYSDEGSVAFRDLNPQAPTHVLVIPRRHVVNIAEADAATAAAIVGGIQGVIEAEGITEFRTVFNTGADAGQSVFHVHAHVLAGRAFSWPPG